MSLPKPFLLCTTILLTSVIGCQVNLPVIAEDKLFREAIEHRSTARSFVLVTIVDDRSGNRWQVCTVSPSLLYALCLEHGISDCTQNRRRVVKLALENKEKVFHFSNPDAIINVTPRYSSAVLKEVRQKLSSFSDEELVAGFAAGNGPLDQIYYKRSRADYSVYRDAIAHVLLEKGIPAGVGCRAGWLWVREKYPKSE